jgi:hypothetical protein
MANKSEVKTVGLNQFIKALEDMPNEITRQLYPFVVELTPHDKGNARDHTTYDGNNMIHADYDYAERLLHLGWSDQLAADTFDQRVEEKASQLINNYIRKL